MIAACVKWTDLRPEIDPLVGTVEPAHHGAGFSDSDRAAVEVALRLGEALGRSVLVVCVGPRAADAGLRDFIAAGVDRVVRIEGVGNEASSDVAMRLAVVLRTEAGSDPAVRGAEPASDTSSDAGRLLVVCGDLSADRGSGAVPAFLAGELGAAQALGLVDVQIGDPPLRVLRRLDGGRRERLSVPLPAVISVEGSVADLRRASLAAVLSARSATVEVRSIRSPATVEHPRLRPWRPRARHVAPPEGVSALERIVHLTGALVDRTPPVTVELPPADAAAAVWEQLRSWGYVNGSDHHRESDG